MVIDLILNQYLIGFGYENYEFKNRKACIDFFLRYTYTFTVVIKVLHYFR